MHCDEHFGQEGDKLGVSSTKSVVDILPQRTSSREENTFFCVVDRWNGIFFTRYCSHFPLFTSDGCCNWFSGLSKFSLSKNKINQKMRHSVFYRFLRFCYFCYMLTVVMLVITDKASDKCTLEANYSMLFISMYKNGKIIPIQRQ